MDLTSKLRSKHIPNLVDQNEKIILRLIDPDNLRLIEYGIVCAIGFAEIKPGTFAPPCTQPRI